MSGTPTQETAGLSPEAEALLDEGTEITDDQTFPASVVRELRQENARRRTALKVFTDAFDAYDDPQQETLLAAVAGLQTNPRATAMWFRDLAHDVLGDAIHTDAPWASDQEEDEVSNDSGGQTPPSTPTTDDLANHPVVQQLLEQNRQLGEQLTTLTSQQEERDSVNAVQAQAREHGFKPGTPEYRRFLIMAQANGGDFAAAAKEHAEMFPTAGDGEGEPAAEEPAEEEPGRFPKGAGEGGASGVNTDQAEAPTSMAEAHDAFSEWIDAQP